MLIQGRKTCSLNDVSCAARSNMALAFRRRLARFLYFTLRLIGAYRPATWRAGLTYTMTFEISMSVLAAVVPVTYR